MAEIRVLVADSQLLFAQSLGEALSRRGFSVPDEHPVTGPRALEAIATHSPDIVLLDYWMAEIEGPAVTALSVERNSGVKIILLSWFHGDREIERALSCGAVGFLPKSVPIDDVVEAVRWAYAGQSPVFPDELHELVDKLKARGDGTRDAWRRLGTLTPRELEILQLLALGRPIAEAADGLSISARTLRTHINNILVKTETHSQMEALSLARTHGLIQT